MKGFGSRGFSLLELMITVAIIGILASVVMPKYAQAIQKAQEGSLKGNLGAIRSALSIYYADNAGNAPSCIAGPTSTVLTDSLVPRYIGAILGVKSGLHPVTSNVYCDSQMVSGSIHDGTGWYFDGALPADQFNNGVWVACDHTDVAGHTWTTY